MSEAMPPGWVTFEMAFRVPSEPPTPLKAGRILVRPRHWAPSDHHREVAFLATDVISVSSAEPCLGDEIVATSIAFHEGKGFVTVVGSVASVLVTLAVARAEKEQGPAVSPLPLDDGLDHISLRWPDNQECWRLHCEHCGASIPVHPSRRVLLASLRGFVALHRTCKPGDKMPEPKEVNPR